MPTSVSYIIPKVQKTDLVPCAYNLIAEVQKAS
jgi:hypothetical protein